LVKKKSLVFISEPSWIENPLPSWLNNNDYFVVTESDSVINECYVNKIDVFALGEYIEPSKNIYFIDKSIEAEQSEINNLDKNYYHSEFYHGISNLIYYFNYYHEIIENIFKTSLFDKVIFIVGERFMASIDETPKGSFLQYNFFKAACSKFKIKFAKKRHQIYSFKELIIQKKRYDYYFTINNRDYNKNEIVIKASDYIKASTKNKTLFIYQYETCKDDLEPLLDQELRVSNVLKMKITPHAPLIYDYDFDLTNINASSKQEINEYNFTDLQAIFNKYVNFISHEIVNTILKKHFNYYKKLNILTINRITQIEKIINQYEISKIIITAFPSSITSVIAKYFNSKNIKVVLRQHGEFSSPNWPLKCFVSGVEFSTISKFYKSSIQIYTNDVSITPRYYKQPIHDFTNNFKNTIIITNDLFLNPTNKILAIKFFDSFLANISRKYLIKLRSHPRYFGELIPNLKKICIQYENSREIDLVSSFENCFLFIMPVDTFSSIISAPIGFDIPSVMIAPFGSVSVFDFKPYYFGYPFVFDNETDLTNFILKIENNSTFKNEVLIKQKKWLSEILDENITLIKENAPVKLITTKQYKNLSIFRYYKIRIKYLLRNIKNHLNYN
jgi:hypothetical protein